MTVDAVRASEGCLHQCLLPDGREICVYPVLFATRLCIGPAGELYYDDAWCYESTAAAINAASQWDGEGDPPDGWHRHIRTGRRRPDGDPDKEYVEI